MSEIPKAYEPGSVEARWYTFWLEHGCFTADPARVSATRPAYSIVIPPPNVTGVLTLGHVLNNTLQDVLARKARMDGKEVLWMPGTDHAGIATQTVVERTLKKSGEIRHRNDLGREKFLERVWEWKETHGGIILQQLRALGASCDWTRTRFTMDPEYSRCVQRVFVDLYRKGLIYRGKRMVNWCPASLTALSDEEVVMKEQKGALYYFKVEVVGLPAQDPGRPLTPSLSPEGGGGVQGKGPESGFGPVTDPEGRTWLTIATTRPETIPGDTAVAVNPGDPRYAHLIGKHVLRPLPVELPREQKLIPIVGDEHVDFKFGTGVLKVTPAHDKADFEIGRRHKLPVVDIMNPDATMNELAGVDLKGLDRFKARKVAAGKLSEIGALVKEEPYTNNVGFSERADVPIEPRLSEQWFLKYPSVEMSRNCVAQPGRDPAGSTADMPAVADRRYIGRMRFFPDRWAKVYDHWMEGIQDWCISRQLWWGHRIPVWYRKGTPHASEIHPRTAEILGTDEVRCQIDSPGEGWIQDPDVLDTWFSSWLWPFATMGWTGDPDTDAKNATLKTFYPTTDLVTGPDIIFFWVARMIMAGYEYMGGMPFRNVYFTGIIRDKQGRKMSKSLGNSPDPLELIARYGADALRLGTMRSAPLGQDILFDEQNVELGRNFCNKLWNACRFRQMAGGAGEATEDEIDPALLTSDDRWILMKLDQAIREVTAAFAEYKFTDATATLYRFFWSEYCDWYVEASKAPLTRRSAGAAADGEAPSATPGAGAIPGDGELRRRRSTLAVMDFVLSHTLRLFHPFLPFITEELWHGLGYHRDLPDDQGGRTLMFARWPKGFTEEEKAYFGLDETVTKFVDAKYELVVMGRNLRREFNLPGGKKVRYILKARDPLADSEREVIRLLLNAETLDVDPNFVPDKGIPGVLTGLGELFLPLEGLVDVAVERARLGKELAKIEAEVRKVRVKLENPDFVNKVPPAVLEEHTKRLADWETRERQVRAALEALG